MKRAGMKNPIFCSSWIAFALILSPHVQAQTYSRTEVISYHDNTTKWVLGQTASVTCMASVPTSTSCDGNDVVSQTTYNATTALPTATYAFGKLQSSMTYFADGTINTVKDGRNNLTTLSNWKRGIPQTIQYADGTSQSAVVNDNGWITSITDENGFTTGYSYDAMGRLSGISYPTGDTTAWSSTTRSFVSVASAEYGIAAGHWRLTETTGNAIKVTYFDGLWRPLLTREYDATNVSATQRFSRTSYDADGRVSFQSYPSASSTPSTGVWTEYDALGRVTSTSHDSELGLLSTVTTYGPGLTITVTNPRGHSTTTSYMTYDQPSTDWPVTVSAPEGQVTFISRDPYGKPTQLSRGGITRSYAYNGYQELCRSVEPETGATLFGYDAAGNLSWSATGLPDSQACSSTGTEGAIVARKASRTYDARNRLSTLAFPDGNGNQTWTYTNDGLPYSIATTNSGSTVSNVYNYNKRRLLISEGLTPDALQSGWGIGYGYDGLGNRITETTPGNVVLTYSVNALGQATGLTASVAGGAATTLASGASYYPNGAVKQFTYGNGIVHTMTQNARQLPNRSLDTANVLNAVYSYDANGNVESIIDELVGAGNYSAKSRWMTYDGLDRVTAAGAGMFGGTDNWHRFTYDALDNLKSWKLAGVKDYATYTYTNNRLTSIQNTAGSSVVALAYDVQGNLLAKNGATYNFDFGNRLRTTAGLIYRYDGLGRRVRQDNAGGQLKYSIYAQDGRVVWQRDEVAGKRINNAYFAGSLLAEVSRPLGSNTVTLSYFHTDALGSPIAKSNASGTITETSEYEPYGLLLNRANDDRVGYTGHVMDSASGLTYMQQRYYDPSVGRFLSVDPVTAYEKPITNFNRYVYALNNPYKFTDPDGRNAVAGAAAGCAVSGPACPAGAVVGAVVGTVIGIGVYYGGKYLYDQHVQRNEDASQGAVDKIKEGTRPADGQAGKDGVLVGEGGAAGAAAAIDVAKGTDGAKVLVDNGKVTVVQLPDGRKVESHVSTQGGQYKGDRSVKIQDADGKVRPENIIRYPEPKAKQ